MAIDPTKVSFSQAQGMEPLPRSLRLGELTPEARMSFWNAFYLTQNESYTRYLGIDQNWNDLLASIHADYFNLGLDEFNPDFHQINTFYKKYFTDAEFNKLFDLILHIVRHANCPDEFHWRVATTFINHRLVYVYDTESRTIFPASTPEEGKAIADSVKGLNDYGLNGARHHLIESATFINQGEWHQSVRESITAVESVARLIAPGTRNLGSALNKLGHLGLLEHNSLRNGLERLYDYTNDEGGIRHAHLNEESSNVGQDEAVFMLGACASFASYLWRKGLGAG